MSNGWNTVLIVHGNTLCGSHVPVWIGQYDTRRRHVAMQVGEQGDVVLLSRKAAALLIVNLRQIIIDGIDGIDDNEPIE